jgi:cyclophilin family peptidyl-prolyl cis-trans isomerase
MAVTVGAKTSTGTYYSAPQFTLNVTDTAPTLTTISELPGATQDTDFTISYATLLAASNAADVDAQDTVSFQIEAVTNGTLTKNGVAVTAGTTTLGPGESLVWHSNIGDAGDLSAFTVEAFDGLLTSGTPVAVVIATARNDHPPTLTTIGPIAGGAANASVTISYAALLAKSDAADVDSYDQGLLVFQIESVTSGTLTINGAAVIPGTTTMGSGDSVVWTPAQDATGSLAAFTVEAMDTSSELSGTPVTVTVQVGIPTLSTIGTLSEAVVGQAFSIPYATLLAASDAQNPNGPTLDFRIESTDSGTLTLNGVTVTNGTLFTVGETLAWTPASGASGATGAFTVVASDGTADSPTPVQVQVQVDTPPTLTTVSTLTGGIQDTDFAISYTQLLTASNMTDPDTGQTLSFLLYGLSTGTWTKNGAAIVAGTTLLGPGDSMVWHPAAGATGSAINAFAVKAYDGYAYSPTPIQVTVAVAAQVTVDAITSQSVPGGKTLIVPITGSTPNSQALTYSVTSSNSLVTGTILTGNTWIDIKVANMGDMIFQMFNDYTPTTVGRIETLINQGFYTGQSFYRIVSSFVAQGGNQTGSGVKFDDEYNTNLIFSGNAQLAMANSGTDTNDSEFFITDGPQRQLDFNYTIFGQLVVGTSIFNQIMALGTSSGTPTTAPTITSISVIADTTDAVLLLSAPTGANATVTVTAANGNGHSASQAFAVTAPVDTINDPPFLGPVSSVTAAPGQVVTVPLTSTDIDSGAVSFAWGTLSSNPAFTTASGSLNGTITATGTYTATLTLTPPAGYTGLVTLLVGVMQTGATARGNRTPTTNSSGQITDVTPLYDTEVITLSISQLVVTSGGTDLTYNKSGTIDFGAQFTGAPAPQRSITLTNRSATAVTISGTTLPTGFTTVTALPGTLAPGASATLVVQMDTSTGAQKFGTLTIDTSDPSLPAFAVTLNGTVGSNFITNLYRDILERTADAAGQTYWTNLILNGTMSIPQVTMSFLDSTEYRTNVIKALYQNILGRQPDTAGLQYWLSAFAAGANAEQVGAGFYGSQEYYNAHGGTATSVVSAFYTAIFGRSPDAGGLAYWSGLVAGGADRSMIAWELELSAEGVTETVQGIYSQYLHRAADPSGLAYWSAQLSAGVPKLNIIAGFLSSYEYFAS